MRFTNMKVPKENVLGQVGKGLKIALTVLDFGRTTFGASCTGAAKVCLAAATRHAARRRQFGRPLADLELVRKKLAFTAATVVAYFAMIQGHFDALGLADKAIEVLLIALLLVEARQAR